MRRAAPLAPLALVACLAAVACSRGVPERPGNPPRHLLLLTVSGLRADHLSCYLYLRPTTAWQLEAALGEQGSNVAIDDLCAQGVAWAWACAPSSIPRDSLRALHTGWAPLAARKNGELPTLAGDLSRAGFATAAFVNAAKLPVDPALELGFGTFVGASSDTAALESAREKLSAPELARAEHLFVWFHLAGPDTPFEPGPLSPRPGEAPGPLDFARLFVDPEYTGAAEGTLEYLAQVDKGEVELSRADRDHLVDLYDGEVARAASLLRGFLLFWKSLDGGPGAERRWDDTLIVFAGTNGVDLFERHGRPRGGWLGIERLRVPLFMRHSGSLTGSRAMAEMVDLADVAPTLREWLLGFDAPQPSGLAAGRSLLPLVDSYVQRDFEERPLFAIDIEKRQASLRTPDWTLLASVPAGSKDFLFQLYDREKDPREEEDVASQNLERVAELEALLRARLAELDRAAQ